MILPLAVTSADLNAIATGGGALNVHVESRLLNTPANNPLRQINLGTLQNATVALPANTVEVGLVVRRVTAGQSTMVPFTVVDGCGEWTTFVCGGTEDRLPVAPRRTVSMRRHGAQHIQVAGRAA